MLSGVATVSSTPDRQTPTTTHGVALRPVVDTVRDGDVCAAWC